MASLNSIMQFLTSPYPTQHGIELGRGKGESRITCMRMNSLFPRFEYFQSNVGEGRRGGGEFRDYKTTSICNGTGEFLEQSYKNTVLGGKLRWSSYDQTFFKAKKNV